MRLGHGCVSHEADSVMHGVCAGPNYYAVDSTVYAFGGSVAGVPSRRDLGRGAVTTVGLGAVLGSMSLKTGTRLAPAKPRKQKSQQALTC